MKDKSELFDIAVADFDAKTSFQQRQVLILTEFVEKWTQCSCHRECSIHSELTGIFQTTLEGDESSCGSLR